MNPSSNAGMELPPPVGEQVANSPDIPSETQNAPIEQAPSSYEAPNPSGAALGAAMPSPPPQIPQTTQQVQQTDDSSSSVQSTITSVAEDKDVIEREWVNKAKAIVESTKEDPYRQNEELTLLKADYLQKRYNKTLKLSN